ncbi:MULTISPECIES: MarR family winged helix-turn-helix transcriptional regulator [Streptomyces]|uniref:MarR family transcriptional regulator n=1 Tax=Streptomyces solicathayae TaxID=3081768 RepID=A0ABZ0LUN9_9ACTN|nr:MarR family transcriptional regulator [Streptomyces sp. HUAS YS2]WOX23132.1 MarR family transcriptional regulator [Streptomyces sp. HUAS YS2]
MAAEPSDRLGFLLSFRGELTGARIRTALGVAGLHPRNAMTLMQLAPGAMSQRDLAAVLEVDPSQLVAILNELEGSGLAERRRDPADRRRHIVEITEAGEAALERVDSAVSEAERELFANLTSEEQDVLRRLLDRVVVERGDHDCSE